LTSETLVRVLIEVSKLGGAGDDRTDDRTDYVRRAGNVKTNDLGHAGNVRTADAEKVRRVVEEIVNNYF
jgi:hypothetical protein